MLFFCSVAMARLVKTCQETAEKWVLFGWMVFLRSQTCVCCQHFLYISCLNLTVNFSCVWVLWICDHAVSVSVTKYYCGWSFMKTTQPEICWSAEAMQALCVNLISAEHRFHENLLNMQYSNRTENWLDHMLLCLLFIPKVQCAKNVTVYPRSCVLAVWCRICAMVAKGSEDSWPIKCTMFLCLG